MDKEEFRIKLEEINRMVEVQDYKSAMAIVDSIDWRRVKNVRTLCVVGEIYAANKRYEDSRDIFLLAYHRASIGKNVLYRLVEISLKMGDIDEAKEYYEEFKSVAPNDNTAYVLNYKILKEKNAPLEEQIAVLEEYKEKEFTEKWSYELANLYYRAGQKDKCESLCNEIILWFSDGSYVMKALNLKMRMGVMTEEEKKKYEERLSPVVIEERKEDKEVEEKKTEDGTKDSYENSTEEKAVDEQATLEEKESPMIDTIRIRDDRDLEGAETLQEKISKGIRDLFGNKKKEENDEDEIDLLNVEIIESSNVKPDKDKVPSLEKEGVKEDQSEQVKASKIPEMGFIKGIRKKVQSITADKSSDQESDKEASKQEINKETDKEENLSLLIPENPSEENQMEGHPEEQSTEQPEALSSTEEKAEDESESIAENTDTGFGDFNLEDTILAAATAQGIEIPKEKKEDTSETAEVSVKEEQDKEVLKESEQQETSVHKNVFLDDYMIDEFISEEDMEEAENEFKNGPVLKAKNEENIPDLSSTDISEYLEVENKSEEEINNIPVPFVEEEDYFLEEEYEEEPQEKEEKKALSQADGRTASKEEELEKFIDSIHKEDREESEIAVRPNELSDEEKKLFSYFVKVPGMSDQIIDALCDVQEGSTDKTSKTGNIIVMGGNESGKTRLISSLIPAICKMLNLEATKVAYVFADQINGKDISSIFKKLSGGFFVIEKANQLDQATADFIEKEMNLNTDGLIVILEDDKIAMRKMIARYPRLARKFSSIINIPVFTNDELANFARIYAEENGYRIDNMAMLSLYNLISMNQKSDVPMNVGAVKRIMDSAIERSQGGLKLFKKNSKKVDQEGFIVLTEKDFVVK